MADYLDPGSTIPGAEGPTSVGGDPLSGGDSSFDPLSLGILGAGAAGLGFMMSRGPDIPPQLSQATAQADTQFGLGKRSYGQGSTLVDQGREALLMAQQGKLTPEQQAQLRQYTTGLESTSRQQMYSLGLNPDANTAFVTQQANIDERVNAMAQEQIRSTIALGIGEIQTGSGLESTGGQMMTAADQTLIAAADAQIKADQSYSQALTSAFASIGKMFATAMA